MLWLAALAAADSAEEEKPSIAGRLKEGKKIGFNLEGAA
jgi:hypothetical protein